MKLNATQFDHICNGDRFIADQEHVTMGHVVATRN